MPYWTTNRVQLYAPTTLYVRTDGDDDNDGSANDSAHAFATPQGALDYCINNLDQRDFTVKIKIGDGTYSRATIAGEPIHGSIEIEGNLTNPENVVIGGLSCIKTMLSFSGLTLTPTDGGPSLLATRHSHISQGSAVRFGGAGSASHLQVTEQSALLVNSAYTIFGGAACHIYCDDQSQIKNLGVTHTVQNTPSFSFCFALIGNNSLLKYASASAWSGSATGQRFRVVSNAVIDSGGHTESWLPGNSDGSKTSGGVYL